MNEKAGIVATGAEKSGRAEHRPTFLVTGRTSGVARAIAAELAERAERGSLSGRVR